jgi:hypothetical protein
MAASAGADGAAPNKTAAFAPGKGTGANWLDAANGNGQPATSNESFQASWQSMLRAWGVETRTSNGASDRVAGEAGETGAAAGSNGPQGVDNAQATFARADAEAVQSALTTNRSNGPMAGAGAPASHAARAIRLVSLLNATSLEASAQSAAAIRAATGSGSSTGVGAGANVKGERRESGGENAGTHPQAIPAANGLQASGVDGAWLAVSVAPVQPEIAPASLADSLGFRPAQQIDEPLSGASETEPEAAIAAIRAKGSPSTTAAPTAENSSANARSASQVPASAAQSTMRDEESSGGTPTPIGQQQEFAAQPQFSSTAPEIAVAGASRAGSATRQSGLGASSGVEEHRTLSGEFGPHRGASTMGGASADTAVATAGADKTTEDSGAMNPPQSAARSAHEAAAAGASAGTAHVVVAQPSGSSAEASAMVRDPGGVQATAAAPAAHGNSAATQAASPQETFAALDAGTLVGTPNWIHAGGRQAEAAFQDPALGWVGVRADLSGGSVHAALVPGSAEAAQALSGHLAGLNAYLAEQQTPVATLTMAAPGTSGMEAGVDQNTQQSAGQHGEQNPAAAPQSGSQPGTGASASTTAVSATATSGSFDAIAYSGGGRGTHISVMA